MMVAVLGAGCSGTGADQEVEVLRVLLADDWAGVDPVLATVRAYERDHPLVRVEVEGVPFSALATTVDASIRSGDPYDLAQWHAFAAGARNIAEPLDDLWEQHLDDREFIPGAIEDVVWGDHRYGVPLDTNAMVIVANRDHLEEAGYGEDGFATFDELRTAAERLAEPFGERRAIAHGLSTWTAYGWIRANGGEVVEVGPGGDPTFLLDDPATVEAMDVMARMVTDGLAFEPATRDRSSGAVDLFLDGRASLLATGGWDLVMANQAARQEGADVPDAIALPLPRADNARPSGSALGGSSLFVPLGSDHRELAFDFAMSLISDETATALATTEGRLPVRRRVFDGDAFDDPTFDVVRQELERATPMKLIAFEEAQEAFTNALEEILTGQRSAAEALAEAQRRAEASIPGRGA